MSEHVSTPFPKTASSTQVDVIDRVALAKEIAKAALLTGHFVLRSGRTSHYYLDKYLFSTQPRILSQLAILFAEHVESSIDCLAGAELGGIPLVSALSLQTGKPCLFIRNQKKEYGTAKQLEGKLPKGGRVFLVEDVCTSGGQILEAAKSIEQAGGVVERIVSTIDREEGAAEAIAAAGYRYTSLFTKSDLGV